MNHWVIEKLNKKLHNRVNFFCGIDILDEYLKTRANKEQENNLNVTYVATSFDSMTVNLLKPILGFYSLSNSSLKLNVVPSFLQKGIPPTYEIPAITIGRLAVDQKCQKQGLGGFLLKNAILKIIEAATLTGIKCVSVIAKNENGIKFYEKYGFVRLQDSSQLVLPMDTLIKARKNS